MNHAHHSPEAAVAQPVTEGKATAPGRQPVAGLSRFVQQRSGEPGSQMLEHHQMSRWVQPVIMLLAAWLAASPPTFGYRSLALTVSDVASAIILTVLAWMAFRGSSWAGWATAVVGMWLIFAPLIFFAPTAGEMANDTLIGALVIGFGILVPHGMQMEGPEIPPGWSYNPSTWTQRVPILVLALLGFVISRYLAAFQLGHISSVWDPFFGNGTERILTSKVSRMFPVSDGGLGAVAYLLELLMGLMGDHRRWRTMPWMVAGFGILVIPLGVVQILLIMLQPLAVGTWCTLCLISAAGMLIMVTLSIDEVVAMGQLLKVQKSKGISVWHALWYGANLQGEDRPGTGRGNPNRPSGAFWGASWPVNLLGVAAVGVWLLFAPSVFGTAGAAADSDHLVGALVVTIAVIALAEQARVLRLLNLLPAAWLVVGAFLLDASSPARLSSVVAGVAIGLLSLRRGPVHDRYGEWDRLVR